MRTINEDVNDLGRALGTVLREQEGEALFDLVEEVRTRTRAMRRAGEDTAPLQETLASVSLEQAEGLVRAFSMYFLLVNMAEEHERVRRVETAEGPRKQGIEEALQHLAERGLSADDARALIARVNLGLTFTAHPTEMRRRTVREHLGAIASEIPTLGEAGSLERVTAHVEALWATLELRHTQPTVRDEVQGGLTYLPILARVVPELTGELRRSFERVFGKDPWPIELPLSFHSWMGGDRDGNPNVTPEVTRETFALHRERACALLLEAVAASYGRLSQHASRLQKVPVSIAGAEEPWRAALRTLHEALSAGTPIDPAAELARIERTLCEAGQRRSAEVFAAPLRAQARTFGLHLVSLDVREHSERTGAAVAALLARAGVSARYAELDEAERRALLRRELVTHRPLLAAGEEPSRELELVLGPLRAVREATRAAGPRAFGQYITSMSRDVSDLLEVLVLAREVGVRVVPVPLFETRDDLHRAPEVMRAALETPEYRANLGDDVQEVMIGYSDSNKDAGFVAAYWALHEAQRKVAAVCREKGVRWRFFHGRGTSIGRGGGPMVRGILGQPPGTIGAGLRITEQGEALADKYSHPELARRNLEQAVYGVLVAASTEDDEMPDAWRAALGRAADESARAYRELVEHPRFLPFFEAVTPINEIAQLRIASRPVRRPGPPTLSNLRAIPWVMAWTQNRANVPGWYGVEVALGALGAELGREMYERSPFFRSMLDNAQMSLAKSDPAIFRAYLGLTTDRELGDALLAARELAIQRITEITGAPILASEPRLLRSIELRNPYIDPIHRLQVELLRRSRAADERGRDPRLERALMLSIHGIAAGVRNAG